MDTLEQARAEIDAVDAQLAALFERRMAAVLSVAQYKQAHGLPVYDAAREAVVLEKAAARIQDPALRPYYRDHVQNMMDVAKQYEAEVLGENRAAYQGVEGAFAHIALRALFPHAEAVSYPTWDEVFEAVRRGDAAHGVVPFENSHAGDVSAVLDLCYNYPELWVVDVYDLPISQNLLVLPGTQLAQLRHVYSHQQAIAQSETFLKQFHLPATAMPNTAMAAKFVAESGDPSQAAIASAETAALYGLEVLVPSINTDGDNTTRFIVLSKEKPTVGNRFSLLFTVDNKPGKLAEVIQIIGASGFNMESIKSRPMPHVPFEYYFYVELVGDPTADETAALLREDALAQGTEPGAFLFKVARNKWLDQLRSAMHKHMRVVPVEHMPEPADEGTEGADERIQRLRDVYDRMDQRCRDVLGRFYYQRQDLATIARAMDVEEESIRTIKYRCMMKLRSFRKRIDGSDDPIRS